MKTILAKDADGHFQSENVSTIIFQICLHIIIKINLKWSIQQAYQESKLVWKIFPQPRFLHYSSI